MKKLGLAIIILWCVFEIITLGPLRWPMTILEDPYGGTGYVIGQLLILALGIWLVTRKTKEERQKRILISSIYKKAETPHFIYTDHDLKSLKEIMSCPTCAFVDQEAINQGKPWCDAPKLPDIENNNCRTWERAIKG